MLTPKLRRRKEGGRHVEISPFFSLCGKSSIVVFRQLIAGGSKKICENNVSLTQHSVYVEQEKFYIQIADEMDALLFRCFALDTII